MPQLFVEDEDSGSELDEAEKQGENTQEIATLRKEAQAFKAVRTALRMPEVEGQGSSAAKMAFEKVFHSDILNLLSMADMWRSRAPPTPLDFEGIRNGAFALNKKAYVEDTTAQRSSKAVTMDNGSTSVPNGSSANGNGASTAGLKDQRALSLKDNLDLFVSSVERLAVRLHSVEDTISFDKDDDDALDFVTAASNLRSVAYGIPSKSRWEVKEMAGNIIPAIATTNAIIAGLIVLQAFHLLRKSYNTLRNVHVQFKPTMPLSAINMTPPNPNCGVCRDTYAEVRCDPARVTLGEVVEGVLGDGEDAGGMGKRDVSVYEQTRMLSDPDWDDNLERTLESLNVTRGKFLSVVNDDGEFGTIQVAIGVLPPNHPADGPALILPSPLPTPTRKPKLAMPSTPPPTGTKRSAPDDDELEPAAKRIKTNGAVPVPLPFTPSKKKRLEDDGLIMLDALDEPLEDDVILVD